MPSNTPVAALPGLTPRENTGFREHRYATIKITDSCDFRSTKSHALQKRRLVLNYITLFFIFYMVINNPGRLASVMAKGWLCV